MRHVSVKRSLNIPPQRMVLLCLTFILYLSLLRCGGCCMCASVIRIIIDLLVTPFGFGLTHIAACCAVSRLNVCVHTLYMGNGHAVSINCLHSAYVSLNCSMIIFRARPTASSLSTPASFTTAPWTPSRPSTWPTTPSTRRTWTT